MITLINESTKIFDEKSLLLKDGKDGQEVEHNGCTYNFNRNIDKLCFKNALSRFLRTGSKEDAFDVFFCYSEIFKIFGGYKKGIDTLLELLYQHESSSATLLVKHRDHYSHSVYVFALGLAIFFDNKKVRDAFANKYGEDKLYDKFLKYWGMVGLFHDVGYPYEISFMQVKQYGKEIDEGASRLNMQYANLSSFVQLSDEEAKKCGDFLPKGADKQNINALFASEILKNFGPIGTTPALDFKIVVECLEKRITEAGDYMDHAYFSSVLLLKKLLKTPEFVLDGVTLDAIMSILLHNSFYKYTYRHDIRGDKYEPIHLANQPLTYLLMLCDELQCWDRVPYGEESKRKKLAWDMDITISDTDINLDYYAESEQDEIDKVGKLIDSINKDVVNTSELAKFTVGVKFKKRDKKVYDYFSNSKFVNLCKIGEAISISYIKDCKAANIQDFSRDTFDELTLEYKLSNVAQAKNYVRHLDKIDCFFSERQLDYPTVDVFDVKELEFLSVNEHIRWVHEKVDMGWKYGTDYADRIEREQKRIHKDIIPYSDLSEEEKEKDYFPINNMAKLLKNYGLNIYRLNNKKDPYILGCVGHRDLTKIKNFNEEKVRTEIRTYLRQLQDKYSLTLYCGFAQGADLLFAEEAFKCNVSVIAVLPCRWKEFISEHSDGGEKFMQLLGQTTNVLVRPGNINKYTQMSRYILNISKEMLVLWDGAKIPLVDENGQEINRGGTYDTVRLANEMQKKITQF